MTEGLGRHPEESEIQKPPKAVSIEFPNVALLRHMRISDLQAIIDDVLQTVELPSWIEPDQVKAVVHSVDLNTAAIRLVLATYIKPADSIAGLVPESAMVYEFQRLLNEEMNLRREQWVETHP